MTIRSLAVPLETYLIGSWHRQDAPHRLPCPAAVGAHVPVEVNDSRWLVKCPACNGAQVAHKTDRRFFCIDCLNETAGGLWVTVDWPDDPDAIEAALDARPVAHTRGWVPGETVADLLAENAAHQVPA